MVGVGGLAALATAALMPRGPVTTAGALLVAARLAFLVGVEPGRLAAVGPTVDVSRLDPIPGTDQE